MTLEQRVVLRAARDAFALAAIPSAVIVLTLGPIGRDSAHAYWAAWQGGLYDAAPGTLDAFNYSPAFAQAIYPATILPWPAFLILWSAALCLALAWLLWPLPPWWRGIAFAYAAPAAVAIGNIEPLLAVAAVLGLRRPWAWAFPLLTKITPALGPVWFAARREWRNLVIAMGATVGVIALSAAFSPHLWVDWFAFLMENASIDTPYIPLAYRLPLALALTFWAARTDRAGWLPTAMILAMPLWPTGVLLLLAATPRMMTNGV